MIKKILKIILYISLSVFLVILILLIYFNLPVKTPKKNYELGITFSNIYAQSIGLSWKETYLALLDDLQIKNIRLPVYWNMSEPRKDHYIFSDLDWQMEEAKVRDAKVILVIGQKVPRWPECFVPTWIGNDNELRKRELLEFIEITVARYRDNPAVEFWQVENEPFLPFGICPPLDVKLLDQEIALVKKLDPDHPVIITDSGELSLWVRAAKRADVFGTTMYRSVVSGKLGMAIDYPIGPNFFKFKNWLIKTFADQRNIIVVELQGEPWLDGWTIDQPLEEQFGSMNAEKLKDNVEFAKKTGFSPIYLWGGEWWYWLKVVKNYPDVWNEAKILFSQKV